MNSLDAGHWKAAGAYDRSALPAKVLLFGTGGLLRALVASAIDDANRSGQYHGSAIALQSTPSNRAALINAQDGLFTLIERGLDRGARVDRSHIVGSISRACLATTDWPEVRALAASADLNVIVTNVTEAAFRPGIFTARLTELLHARFTLNPDAPRLYVIPTELVADNGPCLSDMIDEECETGELGEGFSDWLEENVVFCSSLVDRITTAAPAHERDEFARRLGYADELVTVTEPAALWAIEGDPEALREAFPIDDGTRIVFSEDISFLRQRKLRILNGAHTVMAPVALLAGLRTVKDATEDARVGPFFQSVLFDEITRGSGIDHAEALSYAESAWDRFRNPWIEHEWSAIVNNQAEKMRIRVVPGIVEFVKSQKRAPRLLSCALAAHLVQVGLTAASLADESRWGAPIASIPGFVSSVSESMERIESVGVVGAIDAVMGMHAEHTT